jgi:hypothetical protein
LANQTGQGTRLRGMAIFGAQLPSIEKVLNHASGSFAEIVGVYQLHVFTCEKQQALEIWAGMLRR